MSRYYLHHGVQKPSVTTIVNVLDKPALMPWAVNCACNYILQQIPSITNNAELPDHMPGTLIRVEDLYPVIEAARKDFRSVSKAAMDTGSRVHDAIEQYLKTGREPFRPSDEVEAGFLAFLEWQDKFNMQVIATEKTVFSARYAGTLDLHCLLNGKPFVIDFKSTGINEDSPAYPEHRYQISAYRACLPDVQGSGILYLHKQTGYPNWRDTSATFEADIKVFNILVDLFYASHPIVSKRIVRQKEAA